MQGTIKGNNVISYFSDEHIIYVHKARTAIRIACQYFKLNIQDEILAPSYNCGSEIDALLSSGAIVSLYKVDRTGSIDIRDLENRISSATKVVYITHYFGFPQAASKIRKICDERGLYLIEDCALSLFSQEGERKIGSNGDISVYSLAKTLPVPDGGVLLINNENLKGIHLNLTNVNNWGIATAVLPELKSSMLRCLSRKTILYPLYKGLIEKKNGIQMNMDIVVPACKPEMPKEYYYSEHLSNRNISFVTKKILHRIKPQEVIAKRRRNYEIFLSRLAKNTSVELLYNTLPVGICPLSFPIIVDNREVMRARLKEYGVDAGAWWKGYHKDLSWTDYPDACYLKDHVLTLPLHQDISVDEVHYISDIVNGESK